MVADSRDKRPLTLLVLALFVAVGICLFGTSEIYFPNSVEFDSTYGDVLPLLVRFCLALAVLLTIVGLLIPRRFRQGYDAVLLGFGAMVWFQGAFLKWNYGELDGSGIEWAKFSWQGWADLVIWAGVLALAVRLRRRLSRQARFVALAFIVIQIGFVTVRAVTHESRAEVGAGAHATPGGRVPAALCQLSDSLNVFHIIMDAFQTDMFVELVAEEGLADELEGFVLYKENMAVGKRTSLCVPAIFSGLIYDGSTSESGYFHDSMAESFTGLLFEKDYIVNLMPRITMRETAYTNYFSSPVTYGMSDFRRSLRTASFLVDLSMFRQLPHFLKKVIYNGNNWRVSSIVSDPPGHESFHQKAFFRDYIDKLEVAHHRPAYHFVHLMPPHPPYVTAADGTYTGEALPGTRANFKHEARYILRLFIEFLRKLQDLNLYGSSIILLQGDHGTGFAPIFDGQTLAKRAGRVSALMLLKAVSSSGPLQTSLAQTTVADIPVTFADMLGLDHVYPGESLLRLDPAKQRSRPLVLVEDRSGPRPTVIRWAIEGSVFDSTRWREVGSKTVQRVKTSYPWGKMIGFGAAGNGDGYLASGWTTGSANINWSDGATAELVFGIDRPHSDVRLHIVYWPNIVPGRVDRQRIRMNVQGRSLGELVALASKKAQTITVNIPRDWLQTDELAINFEFPDAAPKGGDESGPKLAIGIYSFQATPIEARRR